MYIAPAAFTDCMSSSGPGGCNRPENISITVGENITFDASVAHIPGGQCGFQQDIDRVVLKRCVDNDCTFQPRSLSTINVRDNDHVERVATSTSRKYFFILSNSTMDDSGLYEAEIIGLHPANSALTSVKREYWVTVEGTNDHIYY